jgi:hypothetical protein
VPRPYQPPSQHLIDALAAAIIVFVTELAQALFTPHARRHMHRAIRRVERAVELMLLLIARRVRRSKLLFKHARVRLRHGAFHQRLARLITAIAQPSGYVQRFLKRLHKGLRGSSLVVAHPPAHALGGDAPLSRSYADSS